jgi:hypothetical protein
MLGLKTIDIEKADAAEAFVRRNIEVITAGMQTLATQRHIEALDIEEEELSDERALFDPRKRLLSEMEVCDFPLILNPSVRKPEGYQLIRNGKVSTPATARPIFHIYWQRLDEILCLLQDNLLIP